jgi:hypothetical protein
MIWPTAADERALALNARLKKPLLPTAWRANRPLPQVVFFGLTCIGVAALAGFFELIGVGAAIGGALALILAELLIVKARWWRTGVEGALWSGGLFAIAITMDFNSLRAWLFAFALVAALAWVRVRYAVFAGLAAALLLAALSESGARDAALAVAAVFVLIALAGLARTWRRPSTEWCWIALLLVSPLIAYVLAGTVRRELVLALYVPFAILCLVVGLRLRHHAPLFAAAIGIVIVGIEVHRFLDFAIEARLALAGAALLGAAWLIARALRGRETGIVATEESLTGADELIEVGTVLISTDRAQSEIASSDARVQGDGRFGGAGATGDY